MRAVDLSLEMIAMRRWLDHNGCELTWFEATGIESMSSCRLTSRWMLPLRYLPSIFMERVTVPTETARRSPRNRSASASPPNDRLTKNSPGATAATALTRWRPDAAV